MSKKRLEEIKTWLNRGFDLTEEDIEWLIEQAERVQELEEEKERYQSGRNVAVKTKMKMDELEKQNKRYREAIEYIQREIRKAIYTPKKQKWNSDFEREFESGKTRGLIQASDIVKEAIEILEGEK